MAVQLCRRRSSAVTLFKIYIIITFLIRGTHEACLGTNLARGRPAAQSSIFEGLGPNLAVDGNRNPNHGAGSCSHMERNVNPWWYVDLGEAVLVRTVVVVNRLEENQRLTNFDIKLSNTAPPDGLVGAKVCFHQDVSAQPTEVLVITCQGTGRYVTVQTQRTDLLSLCEVEVYGGAETVSGRFAANSSPVGTVQQYQIVTTRNRRDCAAMCFSTDTCVGFNYATQTGACTAFKNSTTASVPPPTFILIC